MAKKTITSITAEAPLDWPEGLKRMKIDRAQPGLFKTTFLTAYSHIGLELGRTGIASARVTATMLLRNDGNPYADQSKAGDQGVAVYFAREGTQFVVAIDRYKTIAANMQAVAHVLAAYRTIERHGGRRLALRALEGFRALTPGKVLALPAAAWWRVLGFQEMPDKLETAVEAYRKMLRAGGHPDTGAPPEEFRYAATAIAEARKHFETT